MTSSKDLKDPPSRWRISRLFGSRQPAGNDASQGTAGHSKWSMGVLNDKETVEVPGSVLLLASDRNEPLGLRNVRARTSHSSIPTGFPIDPAAVTPGGSRRLSSTSPLPSQQRQSRQNQDQEKKKTSDGVIILDPQPDDSANDPLNWPDWRRDVALLSLGFYCMLGGGFTPIIAAGFTDVARDYHVDVEAVSLTTGLYMMGLGVGSVIASPTAILFGKRPMYLASAIILIGTCLWAAWSPSFSSLLAARVFQGVAISPVECLPSATIAEIFFLHERAYRIGIYTLLLLSGKNLIPLISAAIIGRYGWRWVFWILSMVIGFGFILLFLFVPETFWDRTPTRRASSRPGFLRRLSSARNIHKTDGSPADAVKDPQGASPLGAAERHDELHVDYASAPGHGLSQSGSSAIATPRTAYAAAARHVSWSQGADPEKQADQALDSERSKQEPPKAKARHHTPALDTNVPIIELPDETADVEGDGSVPQRGNILTPHRVSTPGSESNVDYFSRGPNLDNEKIPASMLRAPPKVQAYTHNLRHQPPQTFVQQLRPFHGRLNHDKWLKVMVRPFILFAYPAVLWSSAIYACSIGWLIVISETMAIIYRDPTIYNFNALQTGLVYISPFVGGILGTGVAGRISDVIVRSMSRRNGGLYEPEFRLVMALPVLLATCIGLMGFGWSAEQHDHWIVPTLFFGILSFGCSLGSTTAITFCVDSYRQYAGEALVTLNFSKNVLHGLVFSLFVAHWMEEDGPRRVYMWLGIIQLILCLFTIPLYFYGKRARMWTVRKNFMEKF
ncbi:hypothetical protein HIM_04960 [Hirsutella minnesotensis 3608]|uniref:Major facilitator superfamily (MFS) profile domain-containing protein n=1 Tax=Hirsutella minnesotensis 3608 TaxID=1043627 RepID=A0A0F7ZV11_9HYPO|nr:hypothetical protein HIM_04960 [Hirsutella minnesotensis 3608]